MVSGRFKSRTFRRKAVKTPSGTKRVYVLRKPGAAHCQRCDSRLAGMPRLRPSKLRRLPKTKRRPERPFGGVLCSRCSKEEFKLRAR